MPRRSVADVLTGAAVLLVAVGFLSFAIVHSGRTVAQGYRLKAQFDAIDGLNVGADVRIAGVKVGSVTDERLDTATFLALVGFSVRDGVQLPKDTSATITSESLLGGKYLALAPGGDEALLKPGETITITQGSISIEQLVGKYIFGSAGTKGSKSDDKGSDSTGQDGAGKGNGGQGAGGPGTGGPGSGGPGSGGPGSGGPGSGGPGSGGPGSGGPGSGGPGAGTPGAGGQGAGGQSKSGLPPLGGRK
jgi:phospholipid/cholesterol/gamma-HCH transport system substrate-binding protein